MLRSPLAKACLLLVLTGGVLFPATGRSDEPTPVNVSGTWVGSYEYPAGDYRGPVEFSVTLVQAGNKLFGLSREPNTFGTSSLSSSSTESTAPWLHAYLSGTIDRDAGTVTLAKTYDGTGGYAHSVEYSGSVGGSGKSMTGTWDISGFSGGFSLSRTSHGGSRKLTGEYRGEYQYPEGAANPPVPFVMLLVSDGNGQVEGVIKEPNTFGRIAEPFLHAHFSGRITDGSIELTKLYDGTGGEAHPVQYRLTTGENGTLTGEWEIEGVWKGPLSLEKLKGKDAAPWLHEKVQGDGTYVIPPGQVAPVPGAEGLPYRGDAPIFF
jgi:hypothetical protein